MKFVKETSIENNEKSDSELPSKSYKNNETSYSGNHNELKKLKKLKNPVVLAANFRAKETPTCISTQQSSCPFDVLKLKKSCEDVHMKLQHHTTLSCNMPSPNKSVNKFSINHPSTSKRHISKDVGASKKPSLDYSDSQLAYMKTFMKKLSSKIKGSVSTTNSTNNMLIFIRFLNQLKENANFQYCSATLKHVTLFKKWGKANNCTINVNRGTWVCDLYVKDVFISQGYGTSKTMCKNLAVDGAMALLQMDCINVVRTIRVKDDGSTVSQMAVTNQFTSVSPDTFPPLLSFNEPGTPKLTQDSIKHKHIHEPRRPPPTHHIPDEFIVKEREGSNAIAILNETAQFNRLSLDTRFEVNSNGIWKCIFMLNGLDIGDCEGFNQKEAKLAAAKAALEKLKEKYQTIYGNFQRQGNVDEAISRNDLLQKSNSSNVDAPITDLNIGNQLLRKMGWSGSGGLGKSGEGIANPVSIVGTHHRTGLGAQRDNVVSMKDAQHVLKRFMRDGCVGELTFSSELTAEERKQIHVMAHRFGLESRSYGKGENRHLVVFLKKSTNEILVDLERAGGQMDGLQLINPSGSSQM